MAETLGGTLGIGLIAVVVLIVHFQLTKTAVKAGIREYKDEEALKLKNRSNED